MGTLEESDDLGRQAPGECAPADKKNGLIAGDLGLSGMEKDRALIGRCLAGDVGAWDEMYGRHHPALISSIHVRLGAGNTDPNLVDEIASRVWYAMIENDGRLLGRFDPNKGARLITFLEIVARTEVSRHFRCERRRQRRERIALHGKSPYQAVDDAQVTGFVDVDGFLATLTEREKEFWDENLAERPTEVVAVDSKPLSVNARQLRHRIREKLLKFLGRES